MGISKYHRTHPVTGLEFDYEHACATCTHFSERTSKKVKIIGCALEPIRDGETFGQNRAAFPACEGWRKAGKLVLVPVKKRQGRRERK
jgi:hypothetical protein